MNNRTSIYEPIKNGYNFGSRKFNKNINGYQLDEKLSNKNHQVYFNKDKNDLLFNVNGTRPEILDWKNNISLGLGSIGKYIPFVGGMKESDRYKDSHKALREAKQKYNKNNATLTGHSKGAYIISNIGSRDDKIIGLDKGTTLFQKSRPNEIDFRSKGDVVSILGANAKHTINLENKNKHTPSVLLNAYNAHNVDNIKNETHKDLFF
jgi:hypothetical protein